MSGMTNLVVIMMVMMITTMTMVIVLSQRSKEMDSFSIPPIPAFLSAVSGQALPSFLT